MWGGGGEEKEPKKIFVSHLKYHQYSADLNYPDKSNKTWIFKRVFLKLG